MTKEHPISQPLELVERVADAIGAADDEGLTNMTWRYHARAAIREVAAWLRERDTRVKASVEIAGDLEQEAGPHSNQED